MPDELDIADMQAQKFLDASLAKVVGRGQVQIEGNGLCVVCGNIVKPVIVSGRSIIGRFCCIECRDLYGKNNDGCW